MSEIKENTPKQQIRNGLVNYIEALVQALPYEKDMAKHIINSILIEEAINISKENKDNEINLFCIKPLFRGVMLILNNRCIELEKIKDTSSIIEAQIQDYKQVISILNKLLDNIKE